jgi:hypothetical protein
MCNSTTLLCIHCDSDVSVARGFPKGPFYRDQTSCTRASFDKRHMVFIYLARHFKPDPTETVAF